jgi:hypothetical protein
LILKLEQLAEQQPRMEQLLPHQEMLFLIPVVGIEYRLHLQSPLRELLKLLASSK